MNPTGDSLRHASRLTSQLDRLRACLDGIRTDAGRVSIPETDRRCLMVGVLMMERVVGEMEGDVE